MVAQQLPRQPGLAPVTPIATARKPSQQTAKQKAAKQAQAAPQPSTYKLENAISDFGTWRTPLITYFQSLIAYDDLHEMRQPDDYWQLTDEDGNPIVLQDINPGVRNLNDAVSDLIRVEDMDISAPAYANQAATQEERDDTVAALDYVMWHHLRAPLGNIFEITKGYVIKRGMCFVQATWLDPMDAAKLNRRFPMRWQPQDMLNCAWQLGTDGAIKQMIVYKKITGTRLYPDWLTAANVTDPSVVQDVAEYWDETHHGVLIGGKIAMPLTPHGYVDENGDPWCPFVPFIHKEREVRIGQVAPVASGLSQEAWILGTPVAEAIVSTVVTESRIMTKHLHQVDRSGGILILKGVAEREGGPAIDIDRGYAELEDTPTSSANWEGPPNLTPIYGGAYDRLDRRHEAGGMAQSIASGQTQSAVSGRAVNSMTTVPRAKAESVSISLATGWSNLMLKTVAIWRTMLNNGAYDDLAAAGHQVPAAKDIINTPAAQQYWFGDRIQLPLFLAGGERPIVPAMLEGIQHINVDLEADTRMPDEVEFQQALAAAQQAKDGNPLVSMNWIREKKLHIDNITGEENAILLEREAANPQSPYSAYRRNEALVSMMMGDIPDEQKQQAIQMLAQQKQQMIMQYASGQVQSQPQGGGGPPPPNGMPPQPQSPQAVAPQPPGMPGAPPAAPPAPPPQMMPNPQAPPPFPNAPPPMGGFGPQPPGLQPMQPTRPAQLPPMPQFGAPGGM